MPEDLVEQFDSRWLGSGEFDPSMGPEGLGHPYAMQRGSDVFSRGQSAFSFMGIFSIPIVERPDLHPPHDLLPERERSVYLSNVDWERGPKGGI